MGWCGGDAAHDPTCANRSLQQVRGGSRIGGVEHDPVRILFRRVSGWFWIAGALPGKPKTRAVLRMFPVQPAARTLGQRIKLIRLRPRLHGPQRLVDSNWVGPSAQQQASHRSIQEPSGSQPDRISPKSIQLSRSGRLVEGIGPPPPCRAVSASPPRTTPDHHRRHHLRSNHHASTYFIPHRSAGRVMV